MYKILLVGAGQLGSRHLQGLKKIDVPVSIDVIDLNDIALATAKTRYEEVAENDFISDVNYINNFGNIGEYYDLAIIATNSNVRAEITRKLLTRVSVTNILFEKFLFQKLHDYYEIEELLNDKRVRAWVNCPRRVFNAYGELKKIFTPNERISYYLTGGDWGLGCNAIHFIDHLAFFNDNYEFTFNTSLLDKQVQGSKRDGFVEFTGVLYGKQSNGGEIILNSIDNCTTPHTITIVGDRFKILIDESNGKLTIFRKDNNWIPQVELLDLKFQSGMTGDIASSILLNNNCLLTRYEDSMKMHIPLLKELLSFYNKSMNLNIDCCPIT